MINPDSWGDSVEKLEENNLLMNKALDNFSDRVDAQILGQEKLAGLLQLENIYEDNKTYSELCETLYVKSWDPIGVKLNIGGETRTLYYESTQPERVDSVKDYEVE